MLEVIIAEVTLSDSFEKGVEFTLRGTDQVVTTEGSFGLDGIGGLTYALTGVDGGLRFKLFQDSSLVNVLSRPSVVVRDGVTASISVGTDIPTVGQTTSDPIAGERQTTQIEYRKTGIELSVTPTVNSKGVVIMTIDQSISNTTDGGVSVGGSPSIFERSINTEVVADSGQTVILGGLISENKTKSDTKVPGLGNLPVIGNLFRADTDSTEKTELVVLVTPRIVERSDQWQNLKEQFQQQFQQLNINNNVIEN
jgi:general secretion pathway protein D